MTALPKFSLAQQIEALHMAETRARVLAQGQAVKSRRSAKEELFDLQRLGAARRTLEWLQDHEGAIRAFLALPPTAREAALAMAEEIGRRKAAAEAGGPAR